MLVRLTVTNASGQQFRCIIADSRQIGYEPEFLAQHRDDYRVSFEMQRRLFDLGKRLLHTQVEGSA